MFYLGLVASIVIVLGILLEYFGRPWGRWHTHHHYKIRTWLGRNMDPSFHWVHEDEPMKCPLCGRDHWRWEWSEGYRSDPNFRSKYYRHVLRDGMYILPCVTCAVNRRAEIKVLTS